MTCTSAPIICDEVVPVICEEDACPRRGVIANRQAEFESPVPFSRLYLDITSSILPTRCTLTRPQVMTSKTAVPSVTLTWPDACNLLYFQRAIGPDSSSITPKLA